MPFVASKSILLNERAQGGNGNANTWDYQRESTAIAWSNNMCACAEPHI